MPLAQPTELSWIVTHYLHVHVDVDVMYVFAGVLNTTSLSIMVTPVLKISVCNREVAALKRCHVWGFTKIGAWTSSEEVAILQQTDHICLFNITTNTHNYYSYCTYQCSLGSSLLNQSAWSSPQVDPSCWERGSPMTFWTKDSPLLPQTVPGSLSFDSHPVIHTCIQRW